MSEIVTRKEALGQGLKRYFTGKPCKHGHVSERRTSRGCCISCEAMPERRSAASTKSANHRKNNPYKAKAAVTNSKNKNPEKYVEMQASYYKKNKDKINSRNSEYAKRNASSIAVYKAKWAKENAERLAEYRVNWAKENAERLAEYRIEYRRNNKDKIGYHSSKRRAANKQRIPLWFNDDMDSAIVELYKLRYDMGEADGNVYHIDHEIPLRGKTVSGLHVLDNLKVMSATENHIKNNKWNPMTEIKMVLQDDGTYKQEIVS